VVYFSVRTIPTQQSLITRTMNKIISGADFWPQTWNSSGGVPEQQDWFVELARDWFFRHIWSSQNDMLPSSFPLVCRLTVVAQRDRRASGRICFQWFGETAVAAATGGISGKLTMPGE